MGIIDGILEFIRGAIAYIKQIFVKIITGILNFGRHILNWFKNLNLNQNYEVPFLADKNLFKERLKNAPVRNVGLFKGVYNEATNDITYNEYISADSLDDKTRSIIGNEEIVVLN